MRDADEVAAGLVDVVRNNGVFYVVVLNRLLEAVGAVGAGAFLLEETANKHRDNFRARLADAFRARDAEWLACALADAPRRPMSEGRERDLGIVAESSLDGVGIRTTMNALRDALALLDHARAERDQARARLALAALNDDLAQYAAGYEEGRRAGWKEARAECIKAAPGFGCDIVADAVPEAPL